MARLPTWIGIAVPSSGEAMAWKTPPDDIDEEELYTRRTYANTPDPLIGAVTMIEDRIVMWTGRCI
jgi:hypothetical protein